jgi:cell division protein FtsZ
LFQVNAAAEIIYNLVDPNANLIFGAVINPSLGCQVSCNPLCLARLIQQMFLAILAALRCGLRNNLNLRGNLIAWFFFMQVRITLIATGFKRQDNGRRPSSTEGSAVEIPEFLRRRG